MIWKLPNGAPQETPELLISISKYFSLLINSSTSLFIPFSDEMSLQKKLTLYFGFVKFISSAVFLITSNFLLVI